MTISVSESVQILSIKHKHSLYILCLIYIQSNDICVFIFMHWQALDIQTSKTTVQIDITSLNQFNAAGISYHLQAFVNCLDNSPVYLFQCYVFGACSVWNNEIVLHSCVPRELISDFSFIATAATMGNFSNLHKSKMAAE